MKRKRAVIEAVHAAYDLADDAEGHASRLGELMVEGIPGAERWFASRYQVGGDRSFSFQPIAWHPSLPGTVGLADAPPPPPIAAMFQTGPAASTFTDVIGGRPEIEPLLDVGRGVFRQLLGHPELFSVVARASLTEGVIFGFPMAEPHHASEALRRRWSQVAAHVVSGFRLRDRVDELGEPDAVFEPDGGPMMEAKAEAEAEAQTLSSAAVRRGTALTQLADHPDEALDAWEGLVSGRWSLVDLVESDGRRYLVAHRNAPGVLDPRALTERERDVASRLAVGHSNKLIAYELGLSVGRIGSLAASIRHKLGASSRADLVMRLRALLG